ncbi:MAG: SMC-Scp complex subunit ScpB [Candidatus Aminicenantes bacterium]|jgi:segregation and condensation protein B|nr:SMC-Scp complex subunit ScpB [Candidatus Aminicenantes bacterium]MCK4758746.1 SMC-Scp complex subunit ScpB [Candidatus Aminicenantes bacterium]
MENRLKEIIESLIFMSLEPLTLEKIKGVLTEFNEREIEQAINELLETFVTNERGIQIIQAAGGYLFSTKPEHNSWIKRLLKLERKNRLSSAALETLSAIAYHQPITLAEISALRGVDSSHTLKTLLQKRLVKIVGRKKSPGNPLIYRTSEKFLAYFGLNNIKDLPSPEEMSKILEEENISEEDSPTQ